MTATTDLDLVAEIAREVESLGYSGIWTNDNPRADGIPVAAAMIRATTALKVGIGVIACERRPPEEIASRLQDEKVPIERLRLGIGPGMSEFPIALVRHAVARLRELVPGSTIATAAMGPRMCTLGGEISDLVLLNWMTPDRIAWARNRVEKGASKSRRASPLISSYIRVADGSDGAERIATEAARYAFLPHYAKNLQGMGLDQSSPGVLGVPLEDTGPTELEDYEKVLDVAVVRALPKEESLEGLLSIARAAAPNR